VQTLQHLESLECISAYLHYPIKGKASEYKFKDDKGFKRKLSQAVDMVMTHLVEPSMKPVKLYIEVQTQQRSPIDDARWRDAWDGLIRQLRPAPILGEFGYSFTAVTYSAVWCASLCPQADTDASLAASLVRTL
jgi:hypothetical protein